MFFFVTLYIPGQEWERRAIKKVRGIFDRFWSTLGSKLVVIDWKGAAAKCTHAYKELEGEEGGSTKYSVVDRQPPLILIILACSGKRRGGEEESTILTFLGRRPNFFFWRLNSNGRVLANYGESGVVVTAADDSKVNQFGKTSGRISETQRFF